jgi:hypothetical protein
MELFGAVLSIPVAFTASMLYCLLLTKPISKSALLSRCLRIASFVVLSLFAAEIALLITIVGVAAYSDLDSMSHIWCSSSFAHPRLQMY